MSNKLGNPVLQYMGTQAFQPPNWHFETRAPTQYDTNYSIGDLWLYNDKPTDTQTVYVLVSLKGSPTSKGPLAKWIAISTGLPNGILSLTGDGGGAVFGDIAQNINIVGDGTTCTTTDNPATHTITINAPGAGGVKTFVTPAGNVTPEPITGNVYLASNNLPITGLVNTITFDANGLASQFNCDGLSVANPAGGQVDVFGGTNIVTLGAGTTISIATTPTITANLLVSNTDVLAGNLIAGPTITGTTIAGTTVGAITSITSGTFMGVGTDLFVTNNVNFLSFGEGALISDAAGLISSQNGTNGQLLIGGNAVVPAWADLTSSDSSIDITTGLNSLDIVVAPAFKLTGAFSAFETNRLLAVFGRSGITYHMGANDALTIDYDDFGSFYPGDGAGLPCYFEAVAAGKYFFQFEASLTTIPAVTTPGKVILEMIAPARTYRYTEIGGIAYSPTSPSSIIFTELIKLNPGDKVFFYCTIIDAASLIVNTINIEAINTIISGYFVDA